jgi:hypothetical protein
MTSPSPARWLSRAVFLSQELAASRAQLSSNFPVLLLHSGPVAGLRKGGHHVVEYSSIPFQLEGSQPRAQVIKFFSRTRFQRFLLIIAWFNRFILESVGFRVTDQHRPGKTAQRQRKTAQTWPKLRFSSESLTAGPFGPARSTAVDMPLTLQGVRLHPTRDEMALRLLSAARTSAAALRAIRVSSSVRHFASDVADTPGTATHTGQVCLGLRGPLCRGEGWLVGPLSGRGCDLWWPHTRDVAQRLTGPCPSPRS